MKLTTRQRYNLSTAFMITVAGVLIAMVYPVFADGFGAWLPFVNAALIGLLGGIIVSIFELDVFKSGLRNRTFIINVAVRILTYTIAFAVIVPLVKLLCESVYYDQGIREYFFSDRFQTFLFHEDYDLIVLYALVFLCILIFTREMSSKLGQGVLWNFIIGKYYTPREESRIFLFIDMRASTQMAENMSSIQYHNLIRDFFQDITEPVLRNNGAIYNYVGDQARVIWKVRSRDKNADCIKTYDRIKSAIAARREYYQDRYGLVPNFRATLHCGEVAIGEIGDVKSQIIYAGDTIFELTLLEKCIKDDMKGDPILISDRLLGLTRLPALYQSVLSSEIKTDRNLIGVYELVEKATGVLQR